ncbi:MAG: DUF11 domain-containing protein [Lewinellaceae bacterium]|nr:DUF11 domain-containing protein [Lewinellaceae bacterium]
MRASPGCIEQLDVHGGIHHHAGRHQHRWRRKPGYRYGHRPEQRSGDGLVGRQQPAGERPDGCTADADTFDCDSESRYVCGSGSAGVTNPGDQITYAFTVTNTGNGR